jgi:hypothetical protein
MPASIRSRWTGAPMPSNICLPAVDELMLVSFRYIIEMDLESVECIVLVLLGYIV